MFPHFTSCAILLFVSTYYRKQSTAVDWANLECSKPPSAPSSKDMAFLCESKLGLLPSEKESRKVLLTDEDHLLFQDWEYISQSSFEEEIVELLVCEEISVITLLTHFTTCYRYR